MLWPLSVVLVANTNGRLAIPALVGLLVFTAVLGATMERQQMCPLFLSRVFSSHALTSANNRCGGVGYGDSAVRGAYTLSQDHLYLATSETLVWRKGNINRTVAVLHCCVSTL